MRSTRRQRREADKRRPLQKAHAGYRLGGCGCCGFHAAIFGPVAWFIDEIARQPSLGSGGIVEVVHDVRAQIGLSTTMKFCPACLCIGAE